MRRTSNWILCADNSPQSMQLFERLHLQGNLSPSFFIAHFDAYPKDTVQRLGTTTVDFHRANLGVLVTEGPLAVASTRVSATHVSERDYLQILKSYDRYDTGLLSFSTREALAASVIIIAERLLDASSAEAVLFLDVPHWPVQLALNAVARSRGLRRPTLKSMQVVPELRPFCLLFAGHDGSAVPVSQSGGEAPPADLAAAARSLRDVLQFRRRVIQGTVRERPVTPAKARWFPRWFRWPIAYSNHMAIRSASIGALQSLRAAPRERIKWRPDRRWFLSRLRRRSVRSALRATLRGPQKSIPGDKSCAVFFLQFEPEGTVTPGGNSFISQADAVRVYRSLLPTEVRLYVQEHPDLHEHPINSRSPLLYSAISELPGTELVRPGSADRSKLAELHSIATLTGSVGLEAVAQGGKAYAFGSAWYRDLLGFARVEQAEPWEVHESSLQGEELAQHAYDFVMRHALPNPRRSITDDDFGIFVELLHSVAEVVEN